MQVQVQAEQLESLGLVRVGTWAGGLAARELLHRVRVWLRALAAGLARGLQRLFPPARVGPQVPTRPRGASPPVRGGLAAAGAPVAVLARPALVLAP